ncbi:phge_HK97_gp10, phage protein, HK97 gp10 family [uncultured Caudovirales phage]|uniref:Phge_HK97_gp10, phage protein, HK97 gp10 family n=1 Tax=uncultured Caudovirales phage TaxID=2100421 RepID=A0A6J5RGH2_9CAUD|nr:phge_HK97_gp10, phage protein, HK97 gp10 family [uncultured Caudovirales phage]
MPTKSNVSKANVSVSAQATTKWEDKLTIHLKAESGRLAYLTARKVEAIAKQRVPQPPGTAPRTPWAKNSPSGYVRTGELKRSIKREKVKVGHHQVVVGAKNSSGAQYGRFVEFGTRYMIAQPFMAPAVREARRELKKNKKGLLVFKRKKLGKIKP